MSQGFDYDDEINEGDSFDATPPPTETSKITVPGTLMIGTGVLNLLLGLGMCLMGFLFYNMPEAQLEQAMKQQSEQQREALKEKGIGINQLRDIYVYGGGVGGAVSLVGSLLIITGGICMVMRKARGLAIFAALVTAIPCFNSPCCLFGVPIGIWALVVLFSPDVRAAFR